MAKTGESDALRRPPPPFKTPPPLEGGLAGRAAARVSGARSTGPPARELQLLRAPALSKFFTDI